MNKIEVDRIFNLLRRSISIFDATAGNVPKEQPKIARHFNAGHVARAQVPKGRLNSPRPSLSAVPAGLDYPTVIFPALKRRVYTHDVPSGRRPIGTRELIKT